MMQGYEFRIMSSFNVLKLTIEVRPSHLLLFTVKFDPDYVYGVCNFGRRTDFIQVVHSFIHSFTSFIHSVQYFLAIELNRLTTKLPHRTIFKSNFRLTMEPDFNRSRLNYPKRFL